MSGGFWRWWGPLLLYMAVVFYSSSAPRPERIADTPSLPLHGSAYFVMGLLAIRAVARGLSRRPSNAALLGGVAVAVLYAVSDEWHQSFVIGRDGELADVLFDALGACLAAGVVALFWRVVGPALPRSNSRGAKDGEG